MISVEPLQLRSIKFVLGSRREAPAHKTRGNNKQHDDDDDDDKIQATEQSNQVYLEADNFIGFEDQVVCLCCPQSYLNLLSLFRWRCSYCGGCRVASRKRPQDGEVHRSCLFRICK